MNVAAWLRELGLECYAQAFADVNAQMLPRLTGADLAAIGVKSVGHRRRLIDAIGALDQGSLPPATPPDAVLQRAVAPMIGREHDLALLQERWTQAQRGEGRAVMLVGEAGIGKSRLMRALLDECAAQPHWRVQWQCSPYHTGSALWPVIQRLTHSAGLLAQDSTDTALDKIETKLEELLGRDHEASALYATLLGLNGSQRYGPLEMTPKMLRERTMELILEQLLEMAEQEPLLMVVEDTHWIDPTTLELLERCLDRICSARMLVVITTRPDHQLRLAAHPSVTRLSLNRLSRACVEALVVQMGGGRLQPHTRAAIVAQTAGVPLFVEELTKAVLETGGTAIPASLYDSLMARLDRISEVKEVAQVAACIGREFDQELLTTVAGLPAQETLRALDKLVAAELIYRRRAQPYTRYTFKHALVQDAAYESLRRGRRELLHVKILDALAASVPACAPEILAHHAARGGVAVKAFDYWLQAGDNAMQKSAYHEGAGYFEHALRQLDGPRGAHERRDQEVVLQLRLGQALTAAQGFGAAATKKAYERARVLLADVRDMTLRVSMVHGLWAGHHANAELVASVQVAREFLVVAQNDPLDTGRLIAHRSIGMSLAFMGELLEARHHLERALRMYDPDRHDDLLALLGVEPRVGPLCYLSVTMSLLGFPGHGMVLMRQARELSANVADVQASALSNFHCAWYAMLCRDTAQVAHHLDVVRAIGREHRLPLWTARAALLAAWTAMEHGCPDEAVIWYQRGFTELARTGSHLWVPFFKADLARALAVCARTSEAHAEIEEAIVEADRTAQHWCGPELWRTRAELFLSGRGRDADEAQRACERSLALARSQGSALLELRTATSLARLWAEQGKDTQARELLAPLLHWFTESVEMPDVREAARLLDSLAR